MADDLTEAVLAEYNDPSARYRDPAIDARGFAPSLPPLPRRNPGSIENIRRPLGFGMASEDEARDIGDFAAEGKYGPAAAGAAVVGLGAKGPRRISNPIRGWHGTPKDFDAFDPKFIGTGQGAASFGHGHYIGGVRKIGENYRKELSNRSSQPYREYTLRRSQGPDITFPANIPDIFASSVGERRGYSGPDPSRAAEMTIDPALHHAVNLTYWQNRSSAFPQSTPRAMTKQWLEDAKRGEGVYPDRGVEYYQKLYDYVRSMKKSDISSKTGRLMEVGLHVDPAELLDWNKPLSKHADPIRAYMDSIEMPEKNTGREVYHGLSYAAGRKHGPTNPARVVPINEVEAAHQLRDAGIPGIVYNAGSISGYRGPKARNYVMFPGTEDRIEILKKYGVAGPALLGPGLAATQLPGLLMSQYGSGDPQEEILSQYDQ